VLNSGARFWTYQQTLDKARKVSHGQTRLLRM